MAMIAVLCPQCHSEHISKNGKASNGKQRYICQNEDCPCRTFILDYQYQGRLPGVKRKMIGMALNGSGIRDTSQAARVLEISVTTVINELKKESIF